MEDVHSSFELFCVVELRSSTLHVPSYSCGAVAMNADPPRKRARSLSSSSSSSTGSSPRLEDSKSPSPPPKFRRASPNRDLGFICTLPPTCSQPGFTNSFATQDELKRHHRSYHRWICHQPVRVKPDKVADGQMQKVPESFGTTRGHKVMRECQKVFPEERLLDLVSESFGQSRQIY